MSKYEAKSITVKAISYDETELAAFVQACKALAWCCSVGHSSTVVIHVDGDGSGSISFDYGDTDVSKVEMPEEKDGKYTVWIGE